MENLPDFWCYETDEKTGQIYQNNNNIKFLPLEKYLLYTKEEKEDYLIKIIILTEGQTNIDNKIYIITYIYYLVCNSDVYLTDKSFNNVVLSKLIELIKIEYFKERNISYIIMRNFKEIYYIMTNTYLCEYNDCQKNCSDRHNTLCSVHLRKKEKKTKLLQDITNLPLDVCNLITQY